MDKHKTAYHAGGFSGSGYGGTLSHTSIGVGVNAPFPVTTMLGVVAGQQAEMPQAPLGMMNVSIRG